MKNIVVIGAGIGGLCVAERLAAEGNKVVVIEAQERSELGYPWYDSVKPDTFRRVGLILPDGICIPKQVLHFHSPSGKGKIKQPDRAKYSLDVHRKKLMDFLIERAAGCRLIFGQRVINLIVENDWVKGVRTEKESFFADLVIDSSGAFSPVREKTPDDFCMNDPIEKEDLITVYREMYALRDSSKTPAPNVFLYPVGLTLAWSKSEQGWGAADVLLGGTGEIPKGKKEEALAFLRGFEPALGTDLLYSRKECIPLRYPLAVLAANGYALVGNSAFLTRPFCGSGIETALESARFLAATVNALGDKPCSSENMWKYTVRVNRKIAAGFAAQYVFRQAIEKLPPEDLDFIFASGLFDKGIVALATLDREHIGKIDLGSFFRGVRAAWGRKDILMMIRTALFYSIRAYLLARSLPSKYEAEKVTEWKGKYDDFMRSAPRKIENSLRKDI